MALQKTKITIFGAPVSYWKVVETNVNWLNALSHITVAGYISKEASDSRLAPIESVSFDLNGADFPFNVDFSATNLSQLFAGFYSKVK